MGLECEWRHAQNQWSWEFEGFKKESCELTLGHVARQLGYQPLRQTVEVGVQPWWWEVGSNHGVEKLRLDHKMCRTFWGVVSIVWLWKTFKNCLSPRVEEQKSEVNKCVRTWTTESLVYLSPLIVFWICICTVVIDIIMYTYTTIQF